MLNFSHGVRLLTIFAARKSGESEGRRDWLSEQTHNFFELQQKYGANSWFGPSEAYSEEFRCSEEAEETQGEASNQEARTSTEAEGETEEEEVSVQGRIPRCFSEAEC